jgi:hypothetical protein
VHPSDVVAGWRKFLRALEHRDTVACLYVVPEPHEVLRHQGCGIETDKEDIEDDTSSTDVLSSISALAEIMCPLSDVPASHLVRGGALSLVLHLNCPVTGCRVAFCDFDGVAFVPSAVNEADPLYDPLMAAPPHMVNINSDVYAFAMFTRDHSLKHYGCEVHELTRRERRHLFGRSAEAWQRIAERTINNYAKLVNQSMCPTFLSHDRRFWTANHRDPAFAEHVKKPYVHEMPVVYTKKIVSVWEDYFERGVTPCCHGIATAGEASLSERRASSCT